MITRGASQEVSWRKGPTAAVNHHESAPVAESAPATAAEERMEEAAPQLSELQVLLGEVRNLQSSVSDLTTIIRDYVKEKRVAEENRKAENPGTENPGPTKDDSLPGAPGGEGTNVTCVVDGVEKEPRQEAGESAADAIKRVCGDAPTTPQA